MRSTGNRWLRRLVSQETGTAGLKFEPSLRKVTAVSGLSGSRSDKDASNSITVRIDGGRIDGGWAKPSPAGGSWEYGGTLVFDAALDITGHCEKEYGDFVKVVTNKTFPSTTRSFEGKISVDSAAVSPVPQYWSLQASGTDQVYFHVLELRDWTGLAVDFEPMIFDRIGDPVKDALSESTSRI